jgi:hypothetical protein
MVCRITALSFLAGTRIEINGSGVSSKAEINFKSERVIAGFPFQKYF